MGYIFFSLLRREKKKEAEKRINKRPATKKSSDEIFRELQKSLNIPANSSKPVTAPVQQAPVYKKEPRKKLVANMRHARPIKSKLPRMERKIEPEVVPAASGYDLEFDPRKAVIFSEILKRPQY